MENILICLVIFVVTLFIILEKRSKNENVLEALGIPAEKSWPLIGSGLPIILQQQTVIDFFEKMYERFAEEK